MTIVERIIAFVKLGEILRKECIRNAESGLSLAIEKASEHNSWFTKENILLAIGSLGEMLREEKIRKWIDNYPQVASHKSQGKRIGVIMAGNIPLVGFHDFLCVLMSGNIFVGKLSSDDEYLLPAISKILIDIEPGFKGKIHFASLLTPLSSRRGEVEEAAAFIATGSNNSSRYFEYYFRKHPHIIRKNRNAIAIFDGTETEEDLKNLGKDIFQHFGLGCRNVSKIFIPQDYILDRFFEAVVDFGDIIHHNKYANNYSYYRTIYLLNSEKFLDNNFLMLKESPSPALPEGKGANTSLSSPVATLYYEYYKDQKDLTEKLLAIKEQIQCIVSNHAIPSPLERVRVRRGTTQSPELWDYADGVDTMEFLLSL